MNWELLNGTLVTPNEIIDRGNIIIDQDRISYAGKQSTKKNDLSIKVDLGGLLVFPGLINCHDHLLGTYVPRVGDRRPYLNWLEWDNDLKSAAVYAERQRIESPELYQMGGYRHLLCGITSVQDHIPHFVRELFAKDMPVKIIDKFAMAHSVTSYALKWGDGIEQEHAKAIEQNIPFITHCSEGFDDETLRSVDTLHKKGAVSRQTVLIHGIAFSDQDLDLLAEKRANVVWCPVSNLYMFEQTARVKEIMERGINLCLGTDSPMSGSFSIFEELQVARKFYRSYYGEEIADKALVQMMTVNAARAMCLEKTGELKEGYVADLLLISGNSSAPHTSLVNMSYADIMLVVSNGKPRYADAAFSELFDKMKISYQRIRVAGSEKIIDGKLLELMERVRHAVKFHKELDFLPVEPVA